jgi:1-acyl-sn-glycerol-3-phosphate acyltransferase
MASLATLLVAPALIIVARTNPASPAMDRIAAAWARVWMIGLGLRPDVEFDTPIPGGSYVVVGNHQSNLDPMCHYLAFPSPLRFLAKKELYGVPVFGPAIRAAGMIEVDRSRPSMDAINEQVDADGRSSSTRRDIAVRPVSWVHSRRARSSSRSRPVCRSCPSRSREPTRSGHREPS